MPSWITKATVALLLLSPLWGPQAARTQEADAVARARAAIQRLREDRPHPTAPQPRAESLPTVLTFCTQVGETAALVAEARQKGMTPATTLLFFRATAQEAAKPLVTHLVTKALLLTDAASPTQARDAVTAHCLDDPMFWTGPTTSPLY